MALTTTAIGTDLATAYSPLLGGMRAVPVCPGLCSAPVCLHGRLHLVGMSASNAAIDRAGGP